MDSFRYILYVYKRTILRASGRKKDGKPVEEALGGVMAPPVEARHIIIIQARLVHRSRFPDRTPSCDVSIFPRSRAMFDILVISMAVHSTQTGEPPSSDIPTMRARWNHMSLCMYGVERPRRFFSRRTRQRRGSSLSPSLCRFRIDIAWNYTVYRFDQASNLTQ